MSLTPIVIAIISNDPTSNMLKYSIIPDNETSISDALLDLVRRMDLEDRRANFVFYTGSELCTCKGDICVVIPEDPRHKYPSNVQTFGQLRAKSGYIHLMLTNQVNESKVQQALSLSNMMPSSGAQKGGNSKAELYKYKIQKYSDKLNNY
jgi:hypothetical protein